MSDNQCLVTSQIKQTKTLDIYIRDTIESFEDYDKAVQEIKELSADDTINVHLNTPGGDCSVGFFLIDQFLSAPCPVRILVEYPTYSMGAIMALCGDDLHLEADTYLMFHDYSGGHRGKGEESYLYTTNFRKVFKDRFIRLCSPFLSQAEINKMFKGEDIYIHHDDPSLEKRIKKHFSAT